MKRVFSLPDSKQTPNPSRMVTGIGADTHKWRGTDPRAQWNWCFPRWPGGPASKFTKWPCGHLGLLRRRGRWSRPTGTPSPPDSCEHVLLHDPKPASKNALKYHQGYTTRVLTVPKDISLSVLLVGRLEAIWPSTLEEQQGSSGRNSCHGAIPTARSDGGLWTLSEWTPKTDS